MQKDVLLIAAGIWAAIKRLWDEERALARKIARHHLRPIKGLESIHYATREDLGDAYATLSKGIVLNVALTQIVAGYIPTVGEDRLIFLGYQVTAASFLVFYLFWFVLVLNALTVFRIQTAKCVAVGSTFYGVFYPTLGFIAVGALVLWNMLRNPEFMPDIGPGLVADLDRLELPLEVLEIGALGLSAASIILWVVIFFAWMKKSLGISALRIVVAMMIASVASFYTNTYVSAWHLSLVYDETKEDISVPEFLGG